MAKKIKSFTVDEEIYNRLVSIFKKHEAKTSISLYLSNRLNELLSYLEEIEQVQQEYKFTVPMSFVIDEEVKGHYERPISESDKAGMSYHEAAIGFLSDLQDDYAADQKGIPREYYTWLLSDKFVLSKDKKFLIDKETGQKYIASDKNHLMEVSEIKSEL